VRNRKADSRCFITIVLVVVLVLAIESFEDEDGN
jgi:hypothetical protein